MHRRAISAISALLSFLLLVAPGLLKAQTPPIPANHVRIHYFRPDGNYLGWTVYAFGDTTEDTSNFNGGPVQVTGRDSFGAYFDVGVTATAQNVASSFTTATPKIPGRTNSSIPRRRATSTGSCPEATSYKRHNLPPSSKPIPRFRRTRRASTISVRTPIMLPGRCMLLATPPKTRPILTAARFL